MKHTHRLLSISLVAAAAAMLTVSAVRAPAHADAPGATDASFVLTVEAAEAVKPGQVAVSRLVVTPGPGYKLNHDFPTKLVLDPAPDGVSTESAVESIDAKRLVVAVRTTSRRPTSYAVTGRLRFAVCTDRTCDPKKPVISLTLAAR